MDDADAIALNHGNTYDVIVQTADQAGNPLEDSDFGLRTNTARPDVPTITQNYTNNTQPSLSGFARKVIDVNGDLDAPSNYQQLETGDTFELTLVNTDASPNTTVLSRTITIGGTYPGGFAYDAATRAWSFDTSKAGLSAALADGHYDVRITTTAGNVSNTDVSASELVINTTPSEVTLDKLSEDDYINAIEHGNPVVLTGTTNADVGSSVSVTLNDQNYTAKVLAGPGGNHIWLQIPATAVSALAEGPHEYSVSVTNAYGTATTQTRSVEVDTSSPLAPQQSLSEAALGVNVQELADGLQMEFTLPVGTQSGEKLTISVIAPNGVVRQYTHTVTDGEASALAASVTVPKSTTAADGDYSVRAALTDLAGNPGASSATTSFTLDTQAPTGLAAPSGYVDNTGSVTSTATTPSTAATTDDSTPGIVIGALPANTTASLYVDGAKVTASYANGVLTPTGALGEGVHTITYTLTDTAGNESEPSAAIHIELDTQGPTKPSAPTGYVDNMGSVTSTAANPSIAATTDDTTPGIVIGALPADTTATLYVDGEKVTATFANGVLTPTTALSEGVKAITYTLTDAAGNESQPSAALNVTVDTTGPQGVTAAAGSVTADNVINIQEAGQASTTLSGSFTSEAGASNVVTVSDLNGKSYTATISGNTWSVSVPTSDLTGDGDKAFTVSITATDAAGNSTTVTENHSYAVDTQAPTTPTSAPASYADNAGTVQGESSTAASTDDTTPGVFVGSGLTDTPKLYVNGTLVEATYDSVKGTLTPTTALSEGVKAITYTLTDAAGNESQPSAALNVTVDTTGPASTLALGAGVADGATAAEATAATGAVTVKAEAGSTVNVTFTGPSGSVTVPVTGNGNTAVAVTLTPEQLATLGNGTINVSSVATDAAGNSGQAGTASFTLDTQGPAFNSATTASVPENAATSTVVYTADASDTSMVSYSLISGSDVFNLGANGQVTLKASADYETNASYSFTVRATDTAGNTTDRTVTVSVSDLNDNAPVFTSGGTGVVAENAATSTVVYTAASSDADGTAANKAVSYSLKAGTGDVALLNIDAATGAVTLKAGADYESKASYSFTVVATNAGVDGTTLTTEQAVTVSVSDLNDNAPVFTSGGTGVVAENAATSTVVYTAASSDADGTAANKAVSYSLKAGTGDVALLNIDAATGAVTLKAGADYESKASYSFTVVATNAGVDGTTLTTEQAVTVSVSDLNEAPTGTSSTITIAEDGSKTFAAADFGFADAAGESGALSAVIITTLPAAGTLKLSGTNVTLNQSIPVASLGSLVYAPVVNANGTSYATIGFKVQDNGGTANGGVDTSVSANTLTINVTAVNDAPTQTTAGSIATVNEDAADVTAVALWSAAPVYGPGGGSDEAGQTLSYKITAIPAFISLFKADGITAVAANTTLTASEFAGLKYKTVADANGTGSVTFDVIDDGASTGANVNTLASQSVAITVTVVNDAPVVDAHSTNTAYTENGAALAANSAITLSDVDSANLTGATVTISNGLTAGDVLAFTNANGITGSYNSGTGVLTLTGTATKAQYQAALQSVTWASTSDAPTVTSTTRTLSWQVDDGAAANHASNVGTSTITITPTNDAPTGSVTVSGTVKVGQTLTASNNLVDPDGTISGLGYQWQVSADGSTWTNISGATGSTYVLTSAEQGKYVHAVATYSDGTFSNTATSSATAAVVQADPVFSSGATASFAENTATSVTAYDATADADSGITYTFGGGADDALFDINASTGVVTFKASPNFEAPTDAGANNVYDVTVRATNAAGNHTDKAVAITVTDVNEAPVLDISGNVVYTDLSWYTLWGGAGADNSLNTYSTNNTAIDFSTGPAASGKAQLELTFDMTDYLFGSDSGIDYTAPAVWKIYITDSQGNDTLYATITGSTTGYANGTGQFAITYANGATGTLNGTSATQGLISTSNTNSQTTTDHNSNDEHMYTLLIDLPGNVASTGAVKFTYDTQGTDGAGTASASDDTVWLQEVRVYNHTALPATTSWNGSVATFDSPAGAAQVTYTDGGTSHTVQLEPSLGWNGWRWEIAGGGSIPVSATNVVVTATASHSGHYAYWSEGSAPVSVVTANLSVTDVDANSHLESATVKLSNAFSGDQLTISGSAVTNGATGTISANGTTLNYSASIDGTTGAITVTVTGTSSVATYRAALQKIGFTNNSENPTGGSPANYDFSNERNIEITVNDGVNNSNTAINKIYVNPINDRPTTTQASVTLTAVAEDTAAGSISGATVANLFGSAYADVEGTALSGVMLTGNAATAGQGTWQWYDTTNSTWTTISTSLSVSGAQWFTSDTLLRFVPASNFSGTPGALTARVADATIKALTLGGTYNIDATSPAGWGWDGPTDALSKTSVTLGTSITAVNDAPTGSVSISGTVKVGQTLTASNTLADVDGTISGLGYQWQTSTDGITWTNISGATASTYVLASGDLGKQVRAVATYSDGTFSNTANSSATAAVAAPGAGDTVINLGASGQLIAPVQVEGKWYYYWDRDGSNNSNVAGPLNGGADWMYYQDVVATFKYDINGNVNPTPSNGPNSVYRFATINGVQVALPTVNGGQAATTSTNLPGTSATTGGTSSYDDLLAVWDTSNGTSTGTNISGVPTNWNSNYYWTADVASAGYQKVLGLFNGWIATNYGTGSVSYLGLEVVQANAAPVLADTVLTLSNIYTTATVPTNGNTTAGVLVSSLTGGITDADSGALKGIAITGAASGTVYYSLNGGTTWQSIASTSLSNTNALSLAADSDTRVYFQPTTLTAGTTSNALTLRAWDLSRSSTEGVMVDTTANGGAAAYSSATDTVAITVVDNVAPTATLTSSGYFKNTSSVSVQSNEVGTAYLVNSTVAVSSLSDITNAADANWNSVSVGTANSATSLSLAGLSDGTYKLYAVDAAGNLSTVTSNSVTVDTTPPAAPTLSLGSNTTTVTVGNLEAGATWQYSTDGGSSWSASNPSTTTTFSLSSGATYSAGSVKVRETDAAGNYTDAANASSWSTYFSASSISGSSINLGAYGGLTFNLMYKYTNASGTFFWVKNADGTDSLPTHNALDSIFNGGSDTTGTSNPTLGQDLERSAIVNGYTVILPTQIELGSVRPLPTGWVSDALIWSADPGSAGYHQATSIATQSGNTFYYTTTFPDTQNAYFVVRVAPVVLDLNADGQFSYTQQLMDINSDGKLDWAAWAGKQDGVLVWNKYGDGLVHDASQYEFTQYGGKTDLEGLAAAFDSNHDGVLDAQDAQFAEFMVWQDLNGNGVSDAGEVRDLTDWGITSIHLTSDGISRTPAAVVTEAGHSSATLADGGSMKVADAAFAFETLPVLDLNAVRSAAHMAEGQGSVLKLKLADVLAQPILVQGGAGDVVDLLGADASVTATTTQFNGQTYQAYDLNRDGQLDLLVQQAVMVAMH